MPCATLYLDECQPGVLPMVCMKCGRPAEVERPKLFMWRPPGLVLLWPGGLALCCCFEAPGGGNGAGALISIFVVLAPIALTRMLRVWTPLCPDHADYWAVRAWFHYGGALAVFGSMVGMIVVMMGLRHPLPAWVGYSWIGLGVALLFWLIAVAVLHAVSIHPVVLVDYRIDLAGVHADFIAALQRQRATESSSGEPKGDNEG